MYKTSSILSFLILSFIISSGQNKQDKRLEKDIDKLVSEKYNAISPGCAILVARNGQIIYKKAFGSADLELNVPMNPEMIFRLGSITKQYTAIAILQLAEQGKISLQDSLQKFVKKFPYKGHTITIENLLTHTSGIIDYEQLDVQIPNAMRIEFQAKQIIDSLAKLSLNFSPGSKFEYSNSNYFLLGYIIEQVSGKSYKEYLQEYIFKPAGLQNTWYDSPSEIIVNRASGYTQDSTGYRNVDYISMSLVFSAGALIANVSDLYKWHQVLHAYKLLKKETLEKAFTPFKFPDGKLSEYGYGWFIKDFQGSKSIGHGGRIDGFRSAEIYFPEQDIFIATLFNSENDSAFNLSEEIATVILGKSLESAYKNLEIDEKVLDNYTGIYIPLEDTTQSFKIYKQDNRLYADLSNGTGMHMALLAQSETLFYLPDVKRIPTTIEFKINDGKVRGLYWTQEKRHECLKSESNQNEDTVINEYTGVYQLSTNKKRTLTISKLENDLIGNFSAQATLRLVFDSQTKFRFEGVPDASCEFIKENGKVTKIVVSQNGEYVWEKIH